MSLRSRRRQRRPALPLSAANRGAAVFFAASTLLNVANLGFHVIVSRLVGPSKYGALASLLVVSGVVSIPLGAVQAAATHAQAAVSGDSDARRILRDGFVLAAVILLAGVACAPLLRGFLHLNSLASAVLLAVWLSLAAAGAVPFGLLLGQQRFVAAGGVLLVGNGIVRLLAGGLLAGPLGVAGAMLATVIGAIVSLALGLYAVRRQIHSARGSRLRISRQMGLLAVGALVGVACLAGIDTVVARHTMSPAASGTYAAAATAARMAMFVPGAVALIAFPRFAAAFKRGDDDTHILFWSLGLTVLLAGGAAAVIALEPQLVVRVLFGARFHAAVRIVPVLSIEGASLAILSLLVYYLLARQSKTSLAPWIACAGVIVAGMATTLLPHTLAVLMTASVAGLTLLVCARVAFTVVGAGRARVASQPVVGTARSDAAAVALSLVMPFFNPGPALRRHVAAVIRELDATGIAYEIIPVSDGSTDGSFETLDGLRPDVLRPVALPANVGKGEALRIGLTLGRGRYLGFVDADGDIPAEMVSQFARVVSATEPDLAIGSKRHPGSVVHYPPIRRAYSWGYQQLVHMLVGVDARDTQTGLKIVRRDVLAAVLPRTLEKRFAFDVELLAVARRLGYRNVIELPVRVTQEFGSTIGVRDVLNVLRDTLAIFYRLRVLRYYDSAPTVSQPIRAPTPAVQMGPATGAVAPASVEAEA